MSKLEASAQKFFWNTPTAPASESESQDGPHEASTPRKAQGSQEYSANDMAQIYRQLQATGDNKMPFHSGGPLTSAYPQKPVSVVGDSELDRKFKPLDINNGSTATRSVAENSQIYPQWGFNSDSRQSSSGGWLFDDPRSGRSSLSMNNAPGGPLLGSATQPAQGTFGGGSALPSAPSAHTTAGQPGVSLVAPESIQWQYADFNGNIQGPFPGDSMHMWQLGNYFTDDLMLRRVQDSDFVSLRDLKARTGTAFPFGTSLPQEVWNRAFGQLKPSAGAVPQPQSDIGWGSPWMSRNPSVQEERRFSSIFSGLSLDENAPSPSPEPAVAAPVAQPLVVAPSVPEVPAPISKPTASLGDHQAAKPDISPEEIYDVTASPDLPATEPVLPEEPEIAWTSRPPAQNLSLKEIKERETARKKAEQISSKQPLATGDAFSGSDTQVRSSQRVSEDIPATLPSQSSLNGSTLRTPVAAKSESESPAWSQRVNTPKLSLKEIKEREAERKKQLLAEEAKRAQLSKSIAQSLPAPAESRPSVNPLPPKWVTTATSTPARSLAEIKQELAAKSALKKQQRVPPAPAVDSTPVISLEEEIEGWQAAVPSGRRSTTARALQSSHGGNVSSSAALRPASVVDELIQWCRITFKQSLVKDVNHEELLELFLSMPVNSEAKEFIAESIYTYSTILDGRRFAHEFLERRKRADAELKPGETWKDVLARSNPSIETDPTFKVVSRKKYRPIAHPQ